MSNFKNILVLSPHPDDAEFGCGGSLAKFSSEGSIIHCITFSNCEASLPPGIEVKDIFAEQDEAFKKLHINPKLNKRHNFPVRNFQSHRQEILEILVSAQKEINPDCIFLPSMHDIHQDHQCISQEGIRAFKHSWIIGYELPWNQIENKSDFFIHLKKEHIEAKQAAISCYKSQSKRNYSQNDFFMGLARVRGVQSSNTYAEAFQFIKGSIA